jgi:hypothetical protein
MNKNKEYSFLNKYIDKFNIKEYENIIRQKGPGILLIQGRILNKSELPIQSSSINKQVSISNHEEFVFIKDTLRFINIDDIKSNIFKEYPKECINQLEGLDRNKYTCIYIEAYNMKDEYYPIARIVKF